jgi:hypothetical protein
VHHGTTETRRSGGIHDFACGVNRLPYLFGSEHYGRVYAMRADGHEKSVLMTGETPERKRALSQFLRDGREQSSGLEIMQLRRRTVGLV